MKKTDDNTLLRLLAAVIAGLGILAILVVCLIKYVPTGKHMSDEDYFGILGENEAAVIVQDHIAQERALILDGSVYIDYTLVQRELNPRFHWDASAGLLLFTTAEQIFEFAPNETAYTVDGENFDAGYEVLKTTSAGMFLSANFMQQYSDLKCEVFDAPPRVMVTPGSKEIVTARVRHGSAVRYQGGIKSPILTKVESGTTVTVLDQMKKWSQIVTPDGYIGYVRNRCLSSDLETVVTETYYRGEYPSIHREGRVNLVWHQIDYPEMNAELEEDIAAMSGVNVISPTWYFLSDSEGGIESFADASYLKKAHDAGLQVWALISNFSENVSTTALLASRQARQKVQNYLVAQALEIGFDGINIDFEGISQEAGYDYAQFMRELSILCRKNQIILSVDVPVPMDFSRHYHRDELGAVCDYVVVMGYDEHYAGSDIAGSVASMDFEITGIENMLLEVPKEKLISGIPFYSRLWYTQTLEDGTQQVTSEAVSMARAAQLPADHGVTSVYDESTGQQYAEWTDEQGRFCQIWLEDEASVAARASLVSQYDLGGIAAWVLGSETDNIWPVIQENIGQTAQENAGQEAQENAGQEAQENIGQEAQEDIGQTDTPQ